MPIVSFISKKEINLQYDLISKLEEKCASCEHLYGKNSDNIYIYSICRNYSTVDGPAMIAIAEYGNTYAIYAPSYFTEKQFAIFELFLRNVEPNGKIIVFSQKIYDAVKKYSYGLPLNVQLYV